VVNSRERGEQETVKENMAKSYENLKIWQESIEIATSIYSITKKFPKEEIFGIISQIRRSVISISSNIAEGAGRGTRKEFSRFIDISIGSLNETENLLIISLKLNYIIQKDFDELVIKIKHLGILLGGFKKYLSK
jgi:four helix bundle protein